jgi:hypothetical protein
MRQGGVVAADEAGVVVAGVQSGGAENEGGRGGGGGGGGAGGAGGSVSAGAGSVTGVSRAVAGAGAPGQGQGASKDAGHHQGGGGSAGEQEAESQWTAQSPARQVPRGASERGRGVGRGRAGGAGRGGARGRGRGRGRSRPLPPAPVLHAADSADRGETGAGKAYTPPAELRARRAAAMLAVPELSWPSGYDARGVALPGAVGGRGKRGRGGKYAGVLRTRQ